MISVSVALKDYGQPAKIAGPVNYCQIFDNSLISKMLLILKNILINRKRF